eukprot:30694-Pelagococcus_subviridis.AAC.12
MPFFCSRAGENFRSRKIYAYLVRIAKTYFRALPRVVASSIELTLRHDVVHNADDVPTKFRDFKRSGRWVNILALIGSAVFRGSRASPRPPGDAFASNESKGAGRVRKPGVGAAARAGARSRARDGARARAHTPY